MINLRHRVQIQALVPVQDTAGTGEITDTWTLFADVWANVRPASVREFIAAGISASKVTAAVTVRYLAGVKASMRIVHGDRTYNIEGVLPDPHSGIEFLTLPVSEIVEG